MTSEQKDQDLLAQTVRQFIAATAAKQPTPGGGSVAGVVGALGTALGEMCLNYTRGKKAFAEHEEFYTHLGKRLQRARGMFQDLVAEDAEAYQLYLNSVKMPEGPEREEASQLALAASIDVPREMAKLSLAVMADMAELAEKCNPQLISDLKAAAALAAATARLSHYNVLINTPHLTDKQATEDILAGSQSDVDRADALLKSIENA